ncbi:MAG: carotenoid oxygenase family protein [Rubrivivax sp.]|nr:carotenoid oxygenase family protein [Rubrivivax sp.]
MNAPERVENFAPFGEDYGPLLTGPYAPIADESVLTDLPVLKGAIPADLNGVYMRAGPNPRFAPNGRYHPFDGDGMIHAAEFRQGKLTVRNRWVRTEAFQREEAAGQATHYGIRETIVGRPDKPLKDSANTDLVGHAGKALALWYMSGDAYEVDPLTLATLGKQQAIAGTGGHISAHAKVDEVTGELMYFDYGNEPPYMHYGVVGADGQLKHHVPIALPGPRLPHDMAVTEHYSIVHDLPLFHDEEAMKLGRHKIEFYAELPTRFGVIPRFGRPDEVRWFSFTPCFLYHVVNAWEDKDAAGHDWITMVACRYMPATKPDGDIDAVRTARNVAELVMTARLWVWRMNLTTGAGEERCLDTGRNVEFPTYNSGLTGRRTKYGYLIDHHDTHILQWNGVRKYDLDSGASLSAWTDDAEHSWYSEPWFASADRPRSEDHGYVIAFQFNDLTKRETLDIFDARDLSRGPVAQVAIPRHIPTGFHGCWIAAHRIAGWDAAA